MAKTPQHTLAQRRPDVLRRFESFIVAGPNGCRLWTGFAPKGIPRFYFHGARSARQVAMWLAGRRRTGRVLRLLTTCGNPTCVAVEHILQIRPERPRKRKKLKVLDATTKAQIVARRQAGAPLKVVAREFGVHVSTVVKLVGPLREAPSAHGAPSAQNPPGRGTRRVA